MKKYFLFLISFSLLASCQKESVEKPANLIPEEKMVNIIYDLSILQAMRNSNQAVLDSNDINPSTYVYKKYKVDSLQFAKSNQYYAAESIKNYAKLYDAVNARLLVNKKKSDTLAKKEIEKIKSTVDKQVKGKDSVRKINRELVPIVQ